MTSLVTLNSQRISVLSNILLLDIECAPKLAHVWNFFKTCIGAKQVLEHGYIMSYAAKWLDKDEMIYEENRKLDDTAIVNSLIKLMDEADIVIAHNAIKFDIATINARALVNGQSPPAPYKIVDTYKEAKNHFKFESYSLEYISTILGCTPKSSHKKFPGFELWLECMRNNEEAWSELKEYNIQDVKTLEEIYLKMRPWIKTHPNMGVYQEHTGPVCPKCGSHHIQFRGSYHSNLGKFRRFQCTNCGGWGRTRFTQYPKELGKELLTNAT